MIPDIPASPPPPLPKRQPVELRPGPLAEAGRADGPNAETTAAALKLLRSAYDHVVIDAPAVLTSPDVSLVEDAVDGVLFVVPGRRARGPALRRAMEQIAPSRMLGALLLGA